MGKCRFCGAELPEDAAFCPYCARSQLEKQQFHPPVPKHTRKPLALTAAALGCVLAAGLFLCAAGLSSPRPEGEIPTEPLVQAEIVEAVQTEPPQTEPTDPPETTAPPQTQPETEPEETEPTEEPTAPAETESTDPTYPQVRIQMTGGFRGSFRTQYNTGSNGYVEYTEFYPNGKWAYHLVSSDGKVGDVHTYDEEGNETLRTKTWDVAGAIEARKNSTD